jgi:C4-dicarboxylate-specific signal transduction histidine kinase
VTPETQDWLISELQAAQMDLLDAARHEALNHLGTCQENLLVLHGRLRDERQKQCLEEVSEGLWAIGQIFNSPLFRSHRLSAHSSLELATSLNEAIAILAGRFNDLDVEIKYEIDVTLTADPYAVRMTLVLLLVNSLNAFSLARGRTSGWRIWVVGERADEQAVRVEYSDNRSVATGGRAAGSHVDPGLRLARGLVEGMGGAMAELPCDTGATFELMLPTEQRGWK